MGEDLLRDGAKGPRVYHWAAVRLPAVAEFDYQGEVPHRMRWALARRSISKPDEIAYYLAYAPLQVTVQELVRVAGARWAIESRVAPADDGPSSTARHKSDQVRS